MVRVPSQTDVIDQVLADRDYARRGRTSVRRFAFGGDVWAMFDAEVYSVFGGIYSASMNKARVLMLFLSCVSLLSAQPPQDNVAQKLVGAWRLVSVEGTDPTFHFAFDHPTGVII